MSQLVDLMPARCRKRMKQRSHMRRWIALYVCAAIGIVAAGATARMFEHARLLETKALRAQVDFNIEQQRQAERLEQAIGVYDARVERHESLAWPVKIGDVIAVIGQVTPESVSLTSLAVSPRRERVSRSRRSGAGGNRVEPGMRIVIELKGIAPDDQEMALLVSELEGHRMFKSIAVDYARKAQIRGVEGREFGVTCEIDADSRYVYMPTDELEGGVP